MLTKREPSRPAYFEYCPIFGERTASCSTVLREEPSQRKTQQWRAIANDRICSPAIPHPKQAMSSVFFISS